MNKLKAILCAALSVCIISVPLTSAVVFNAGAEDIKTLQDKINELDAKSNEYQAILDETESDITEKEAYSEALVSKISTLNEKVILTREAISDLNDDINAKQDEIDEGNANIEGQIDALCERLRLIYMAGSASNLEILLGAKDFGDFVDKLSLVKTLSDYDKELINEINGKLDVIEEQKKELEADKTSLEEQETSLNGDLEELNSLLEENQAVLTELTAKSEKARAALQDSSSESAQLEAQVAQYFAAQQAAAQSASAAAQAAARQQAAQQQQAAANNNNNNNSSNTSSENGDDDNTYENPTDSNDDGSSSTPVSGGYTWPCPSCFILTSLWAEDRTTYNHGAIDIGCSYGSTVVAAESGTVSYTNTTCYHNWGKNGSCGCGGGFGNYVWMNHGNGKETIYAHLTSVVVSPGQYVTKGQVIGYSGSTGYSTGPHLHFECRYYGTKYNPMDELSAYWGMVTVY